MTIEKNAFRVWASELPVGGSVAVQFTGDTLKGRSGEPVCLPVAGMDDPTIGSGTYTFLGTKRGRGKGGSMLMRMRTESGIEFAFGTPELASVVSMSLVGSSSILGYASESDMPESRPPRPDYASRLKAICMTLIPLSAEHPVRVTIRASDPRLTGTFHVTEAQRHVGRHGQVSLRLTNVDSGAIAELWTYRHSGVVEHLAVEG